MKKATKSIHSGTIQDTYAGGVNSPIYVSTSHNYLDGTIRYPRANNIPNQIAVAKKVAALENCENGLVFSSGMAAISAAFITFLKPGDEILMQSDIYGGSYFFTHQFLKLYGIQVTLFNGNDLDEMDQLISNKTKLIHFETPSNPVLRITDIKKLSKIAKAHGVLTMVDNTFATPLAQNPADLGIDVIMHSGTKYLSGHSDLINGILCGSNEIIEEILPTSIMFGATLDARLCYELERSIKSLDVRFSKQCQNAHSIAEFLESQEQVSKVHYPGLTSHTNHELAKTQMKLFGAMITFELNENIDSIQFQRKLSLISPAVSLAGIESQICSPHLTSHHLVPANERLGMGISNQMLRFSVGCENVEDLKVDLEKAFKS